MAMKKPIHVLQVSKSTGGVGQYLRMLANLLDKERFQITAVCLSDGGNDLAAELSKIEGVRAASFQMNRFKIDPFSDSKVFIKLARLIRQDKFDLIHAHASKPGFLTRVAAFGTGIPCIYGPHCFSFHSGVPQWKANIYAAVEHISARWLTAKILAVSEDERVLARRYRVGTDSQILTVHTGIELAPFDELADRNLVRASLGIPDTVFLIGCVGRMSIQKAPFDFVNAAALVHKDFPDAHFLWVGDGELMADVRALVRLLNMDKVFHFARHRTDVPSVLQSMDCFVLASHWEGFSLSVLEAMAARLPVIMSRVSGALEAVLDGMTGYIVPIADPPALADAIGKLVANPQEARAFGLMGRKRLEQNFTVQCMIKEIENLYQEVVVGKLAV